RYSWFDFLPSLSQKPRAANCHILSRVTVPEISMTLPFQILQIVNLPLQPKVCPAVHSNAKTEDPDLFGRTTENASWELSLGLLVLIM
ncbi:MAG: hypothetical protein ACTS8P_03735, partial [Arsenophonus sp. NC-XBC3-MAG3]